MDFKIGDEIEETSEDDEYSEKKNRLPLIIAIVIAIVVGLVVFFVSNALFGKKETPVKPLEPTPLSLTEENVQILYDYVTYGTKNERNPKFFTSPSTNINSFTNEEKFYYALQFAQPEDFEYTEQLDEEKHKIYLIQTDVISNYMRRFFGDQVSYDTDIELDYPFSFRINNKNVGHMVYSKSDQGYLTTFTEFEDDVSFEGQVAPYYAELVSATKEIDGTYTLVEKVIFTRAEKHGDNYTVYIYKDYGKTQLIETKPNQTEEMLIVSPINIKNYTEKATTITYHFALDRKNTLYFESSTTE